jgi:hypothetical protein
MPTARGGFSVAAVSDLIFAGGGEAFEGGGCTFDRAEVFDTVTQTWMRASDMPSPRHGITSVGFEGRWYVIGGATGAGGRTLTTATGEIAIFEPEIE